jgi:RHS repeat-associated protein
MKKENGRTAARYAFIHRMKFTRLAEWTEDSTDMRNLYTYDGNGNLATKQEQSWSGGSYSPVTSWTYTWDVQDRLVKVEKENGGFGGTDLKTIEYQYCPACGGAMTDRIEKDENGAITSWVRYEYEGLNLIRMDQMYDGSDTGSDLNDGDPFRPLSVYTHGRGSISQIVQNKAYTHTDGDAVPDATTEIYYFYDRMGNMLNVDYGAGTMTWDMDAYGNQTDSGTWPGMDSNGPKERLTGKIMDDETGLYYFHARWYDPEVGRFVSMDPQSKPGGARAQKSALTGCGKTRRFTPPKTGRSESAYLLCAANPVVRTDPTGEKWWDAIVDWTSPLYNVCCFTSYLIGGHPQTIYNMLINEGVNHRWGHCVIACELQRACGTNTTDFVSVLKEIWDLLDIRPGHGTPSRKDYLADWTGLLIGRNQKGDCGDLCDGVYPMHR